MNEISPSGTLQDTHYSMTEPTPNALSIGFDSDGIMELGEDFDISEFQVVRREFFAHIREPSITFNNCKFSVNAACLNRFPNYDYAQILINRKKSILIIRPCSESDKDSFSWCSINAKSKEKRKPKAITCRLFFAKVVEMMNWNPDYRYKILGNVIHANQEYLIMFDLTSTEIYQKTIVEGQKPKTTRTPVFPAEWKDQFGLPYNEHQQSMQVNIFDGYAIYSIKGNSAPKENIENGGDKFEQQ